MGFFSDFNNRHRQEPKRTPVPVPVPEPEEDQTPEIEDCNLDVDDDELANARRLFNEGRELLSEHGEAERGLELITQAVAAGLPEAALFLSDVYLAAFEKQYPQNFRPRWCQSLENAKAFCSFYIMAEHFGADENELHNRMLQFLSHFGGELDIDYFNSEVYLPLKLQVLARLAKEGM